MKLQGTISGPTLVDDFMYVYGVGQVHFNESFIGRADLLGGTIFNVPILTPDNWPYGGTADAEPVTIELTAYHAAGGAFDSLSVTGKYCHDGISGLGTLIPSNATLQAILDAVRQTWT
jgi:hypothetical protein